MGVSTGTFHSNLLVGTLQPGRLFAQVTRFGSAEMSQTCDRHLQKQL